MRNGVFDVTGELRRSVETFASWPFWRSCFEQARVSSEQIVFWFFCSLTALLCFDGMLNAGVIELQTNLEPCSVHAFDAWQLGFFSQL